MKVQNRHIKYTYILTCMHKIAYIYIYTYENYLQREELDKLIRNTCKLKKKYFRVFPKDLFK